MMTPDIERQVMAGHTKRINEQVFRNHLSTSLSDRSIFKVPIHLRQSNDHAFDPRVISIGPYHRGKEHLKAMEVYKKHYLKKLLERRGDKSVDRYMKALRKMEEKARRFYSEPLDHISGEAFVEMLLLDGCFIIEFICKNQVKELRDQTDDHLTHFLSRTVTRDLLLIENQLPFFVLLHLFHMITMPNKQEDFKDMIFSFFSDMMPGTHQNAETTMPLAGPQTRNNKGSKHLLGLLHDRWLGILSEDEIFLLPDEIYDDGAPDEVRVRIHDTTKVNSARYLHPDEAMFPHIRISSSYDDMRTPLLQNSTKKALTPPAKLNLSESEKASSLLPQIAARLMLPVYNIRAKKAESESEVSQWNPIPTATELREAGVKFKPIKERSFSEISFEKGVMWIPTLKIDDDTESTLRNLIAYEQCYQNASAQDFIDYITLFDCLINTVEDVELLCRRKVIDNWLGDHQTVATIFNGLRNSVLITPEVRFCYTEVFTKVHEHCARKSNIWMANLRQNYFNTPWAWMSFIAALFLLILTVLQTLYTVIPYYE